MKRVYQHHTTEKTGYYQSILESEGIPTFLKNETTLQVEGTGFPNYVLAELHVVDDDDYDKAIDILSAFETKSQSVAAPND